MIKIINLTSHDLTIVNAQPASLENLENVETETIKVYKTLNGKWVDVESQIEDITLVERKMEVDMEEVENLAKELEEKYAEYGHILAVVALPVLLALKSEDKNVIGKVRFVSVVQATKRGIYPPAACKKVFSK